MQSSSTSATVLFDREFTPQETEILKGVLDPTSSVELIIPKQIDPQQLWTSFETCCHVVTSMKAAGDRVKPIIGRMLVVLQDYPEIIKAKGYTNYEDFMKRGMWELFRINRSEAYHCRNIAERFPDLTIEQFKQIGIAKMEWLSRLAKENPKAAHKLLPFAEEHTVSEVKHEVLSQMQMKPDEIYTTTILIDVTIETAKAWEAFIGDPAIHAYCETENPGKIFARLLDEGAIEWRAAGEYALAGGR